MVQPSPILAPRGKRRIVYGSDPSNVVFYQVGRQTGTPPDVASARQDPARPDDLIRWVDNLADNGVDTYAQTIYAQGWTLYYQSERFEYDARPQHQRFVPMMEAGITPLDVLIDRCHQRGMEFVAKFWMNDLHARGKRGARFVLDNKQWWLKEYPPGLDYRIEEVRDYVFGVADEVASRFAIDGLLLDFMRWGPCFPRGTGPDHHPIMTDWVRRVRKMLSRRGDLSKRPMNLGVMVPQTFEECRFLGYDVETWIRDGLVDYVCPGDRTFSDFNARYEAFSALTRNSNCMLYPTLMPMLCYGANSTLLRPENYRALAQNFYGAGADGFSVHNFLYHWARMGGAAEYAGPVTGYPLALTYLRDLDSPKAVARRTRHYRFHPLWGGAGEKVSLRLTGAVKNDKIELSRSAGTHGNYRFRLCEPKMGDSRVTITFAAQGLLPEDQIAISINGKPIGEFQRVFHPDGRLEEHGRPLPAYSSVWFESTAPPLNSWDNYLGVELTQFASVKNGSIVIDEIEVVVMPGLMTEKRHPTDRVVR